MGGRLGKETSKDSRTPAVPADTCRYSSRQRSRAPFEGVKQSGTYDLLFKLVTVGDGNTGKSAMVERLKSGGEFVTSYIPTIGVDFCVKGVEIDDLRMKVQVWDIGSDKRFQTLRTAFYRGASGVIVVFSVTSRDSFVNIQHWIEEVGQHTSEGISVVLVGNKCDLEEERQVAYLEAKQFADKRGLLYIEVSAKENTNIELALLTLLTLIGESSTYAVQSSECAVK